MEQASPQTNFFIRQLKKLSFQVILLVIIFIICCWGLFAIADMIFEDKNLAFDERVFAAIVPYYNDGNTRLMNFITFFGSHNFLLPANLLLIGIFLFYKKHRAYSLKIASVAITSTAVLFLLKFILKRERPLIPLISKAHGYSFPSGHTISGLVFFGMLAYIIYKTIKNKFLKWALIILMFCFAFLVGFSRVYLKLHYASDVIAGFCIGIIWLLLAKWILIKADKVNLS
ncbi:MAG: phosphatase PAP2 family protein [Ferruginibacter sp.]